jgi:hypothetical protein
MKSRVMPAIYRLLQAGFELDKNSAAAMAYCDPKTAQRVLAHLWLVKEIHISGWEREHGAPIPSYKFGAGRDAKRPDPLTYREKRARRRADPVAREQEAAVKRWQRSVGKVVRLGVFGV